MNLLEHPRRSSRCHRASKALSLLAFVAVASHLGPLYVSAQSIGFNQAGISYSGQLSQDGATATITVSAPAGVIWAGIGYNGASMDGTSIDLIMPLSGGGFLVSSRLGSGYSLIADPAGYNLAKIVSSNINPDKSWTATFTRPIQPTKLEPSTSNFIWAANMGADFFPASTTIDFDPPGDHGPYKGAVNGITLLAAVTPVTSSSQPSSSMSEKAPSPSSVANPQSGNKTNDSPSFVGNPTSATAKGGAKGSVSSHSSFGLLPLVFFVALWC